MQNFRNLSRGTLEPKVWFYHNELLDIQFSVAHGGWEGVKIMKYQMEVPNTGENHENEKKKESETRKFLNKFFRDFTKKFSRSGSFPDNPNTVIFL